MSWDIVVYSHIAHQESPESNVALFRKVRMALRSGGTLVINDFVLGDDRSGPPFALLFHANMLLLTQEGGTWLAADYRAWLGQAGFTSVSIEPTPTPATLILAR